MRGKVVSLIAAVACGLGVLTSAAAQDAAWTEIKADSLDGWSDPGTWWKVEDGAFVADCPGGEGVPKVHYLSWSGKVEGDFELQLEYRIIADAPQDAGFNFRVERPYDSPDNLPGYQAELVTADPIAEGWGRLFGNIHDGKRGRMFRHGSKVTIAEDGSEKSEDLEAPFVPGDVFKKPPAWNACSVKVVGDHVQLFLNGVLANEIVDGDVKQKSTGDTIALQCRPVNKYRFEVRGLKYRALSGN